MLDSPTSDRLADLAPHVAGIETDSSPGFDAARGRVTWNRRLARARAPVAIVEAASPGEVAETVRFARRSGLEVVARGGGHSYEAAALREGTLMLDLGRLQRLEIDEESGTAWVGAAVTGASLIEQLAGHDLGFPIGHCADVALSGYVLAGGFGWNSGIWGPASANVKAVELVLADGTVIVASADRHADLFWAVRGAGCRFFAVVTAYKLRLHPLPASVAAWSASFTAASAGALASWLNEATQRAARGAEIACLLGPHHLTGDAAVLIHASATGASAEEARAGVAAFALPPRDAVRIGKPSLEIMRFAELTRLATTPSGKRVAADHVWSEAPPGDLLTAIAHLAGVPDGASTANVFAQGGGARVSGPHDARHGALSVGGATGVGIYAMWDDPAHDRRHLAWVRAVDDALAAYRTGRYVGEANLTADPSRLAECFTPDALARIEALRARHDPDGLFPPWP